MPVVVSGSHSVDSRGVKVFQGPSQCSYFRQSVAPNGLLSPRLVLRRRGILAVNEMLTKAAALVSQCRWGSSPQSIWHLRSDGDSRSPDGASPKTSRVARTWFASARSLALANWCCGHSAPASQCQSIGSVMVLAIAPKPAHLTGMRRPGHDLLQLPRGSVCDATPKPSLQATKASRQWSQATWKRGPAVCPDSAGSRSKRRCPSIFVTVLGLGQRMTGGPRGGVRSHRAARMRRIICAGPRTPSRIAGRLIPRPGAHERFRCRPRVRPRIAVGPTVRRPSDAASSTPNTRIRD